MQIVNYCFCLFLLCPGFIGVVMKPKNNKAGKNEYKSLGSTSKDDIAYDFMSKCAIAAVLLFGANSNCGGLSYTQKVML